MGIIIISIIIIIIILNKKLSWCWQTRTTRLGVSQGHQARWQYLMSGIFSY